MLRTGKRVKVTGRILLKGGGTVELGDYVSIRGDFGSPVGFNVATDATLSIGANSFVNKSAYFAVAHNVTVGENCFIGPGLHVYDRNGHYRSIVGTQEGVNIGDNVWLGARTTLLPGADVGDGAIVGAGSLVKGEIPENTLAVGSPAKPIKEIPMPDIRE